MVEVKAVKIVYLIGVFLVPVNVIVINEKFVRIEIMMCFDK